MARHTQQSTGGGVWNAHAARKRQTGAAPRFGRKDTAGKRGNATLILNTPVHATPNASEGQ